MHVTVCGGHSALDDGEVGERLRSVAALFRPLELRAAGAIQAPDPHAPDFQPFEALYLPLAPSQDFVALRGMCLGGFGLRRVHEPAPHLSLAYGTQAREAWREDPSHGPLRFSQLEARADVPEHDLAQRMASWSRIGWADLSD